MRRSPITRIEGQFSSACRLAVLLCGHAAFFIVPMAIVAALPSMARTFAQQGAANGVLDAKLVLIASALSSIVGAPAVPLATRRIGKRFTLLTMFLLYALSGGVGCFVTAFVPLLASRVILGFVGGALGTLCIGLIADYYEEPARSKLFGITTTVQVLIAFVTMGASGWLVDRFGWGYAFAVYPVMGLTLFMLGLFAITEPPLRVQPKVQQKREQSLLKWLRPAYAVYLLILILGIGLFVSPIQGPFLLASLRIAKATGQGLIASMIQLSAMMSGLAFGYIRGRIAERWLIAGCSGALGLSVFAAGLAGNAGQVVVCYFGIGLAAGIIGPIGYGMIIIRVSIELRDTAVGLLLSIVAISQFLNPIVCAPFSHAFGVRGPFIGIGILLLITMFSILAIRFGENRSPRSATLHFISATRDTDALTALHFDLPPTRE